MALEISYWWVGILTYLPFHGLHVVLWRTLRVRHEVLWLLVCLLILPTILWTTGFQFFHEFTPPLISLFFHWLIAANYIAIYPAFQASSPTIHILCVAAKHQDGISMDLLIQKLSHLSQLENRLNHLTASRLLIRDNQELRLSPSGKIIAYFFVNFRKFLGLTRGEG